MGKQKKHKKKMPEDDKNNVAFYKKKNLDQCAERPNEMSSTSQSQNPEPNPESESTTMSSTPNKSWSQIAGINIKSATRVMPPQRKIIKIKPEF